MVIHRKGYDKKDWKLEIGFSTLTLPDDYFLWIWIDEKYIKELEEKFDLKKSLR